jgi:carbonic anhydrase/acetyltransferase-like protein (isoleucine patch superfamily)
MALAGLAVGERAAVGERDRVVGGVEVGDRVLVATRAALVSKAPER